MTKLELRHEEKQYNNLDKEDVLAFIDDIGVI